MNLPMAPTATPQPLLSLEGVARLQDEVRALARERNAVILAHNYQLPEVQESPTSWATRSASPSRPRARTPR